jgi:hypothetical protein
MEFERVATYRLYDRGGPGLVCDVEGLALRDVALAIVETDDNGERRCRVRPVDEVGRILSLAYGPQPDSVVRRCHRGLKRAARHLRDGDIAGAGIEAVLLRFPEVGANGLSKLTELGELEKAGTSWENEPRVPAGNRDGGQWTTGGEAPSVGVATGSRGRGGGHTANAATGIPPSRPTGSAPPITAPSQAPTDHSADAPAAPPSTRSLSDDPNLIPAYLPPGVLAAPFVRPVLPRIGWLGAIGGTAALAIVLGRWDDQNNASEMQRVLTEYHLNASNPFDRNAAEAYLVASFADSAFSLHR